MFLFLKLRLFFRIANDLVCDILGTSAELPPELPPRTPSRPIPAAVTTQPVTIATFTNANSITPRYDIEKIKLGAVEKILTFSIIIGGGD